MKKLGFTLAEVLITLGIIGVVAAVTIPTHVANFQNRAWEKSSFVFETKLKEALKTMNTEQTLAGYNSTEEFVNELSKHFKMNKICKNGDSSCFTDVVYWGVDKKAVNMTKVKNATNFGQNEWHTETIGVEFANGVTALIAYNPKCTENPYSNQVNGTNCLAILYDTDGFKNPNTQLKDLRSINVLSLDGKNCTFKIDGICFTAPFSPDAMSLADCEAQKEDLGIKECFYEEDFWAGAVKTCGGVSKMPSMAQIAKIANYVYNNENISTTEQTDNIILDTDKVVSLGFSQHFSGWFYIWSGQEYSKDLALHRDFGPNSTIHNGSRRNNNSIQVVCLGD